MYGHIQELWRALWTSESLSCLRAETKGDDQQTDNVLPDIALENSLTPGVLLQGLGLHSTYDGPSQRWTFDHLHWKVGGTSNKGVSYIEIGQDSMVSCQYENSNEKVSRQP